MLNRLNSPAAFDFEQVGEDKKGFDLRGMINFVWRQWKLIAGATMIATLLGGISIGRQTPLYTSYAQLLLDPIKEKTPGQDTNSPDQVMDLSIVESQMAIIRSSSLLRRVVDKERLVNDPEFGGGPPGGGPNILASIKNFFSRGDESPPVATTNQTIGGIDQVTPETAATIENVKGAVNVARAGQAYVLLISFTSADPAKAGRLANAVADAYVVDKLDARFEATKRATGWLSDRLVELRQQLRESEEAVAQFRADNKLVQTSASGTLTQDQLGQLNARLVTARADVAEKKARLDLLQRIENGGGNISALPDVINSGTIADLRKQENDATRQEADLLARYSDRHPAVVNIRAQLADIRRAKLAEIKRLASNIGNEYELAKASQNSIEKSLREITGQNDLDNTKSITLRELERTAAVNKSLFEDFLQRSRVTQQQSTFSEREARIISPARIGDKTSPKTTQAMLSYILMGLFAGLGAAFLVEKLNTGFTTPNQVEEFLRLPLLASITKMEPRDLTIDSTTLTMPAFLHSKPMSKFSEAMRLLRSSIQMSDVDNPPKVLQLTSTLPGEGKSTIALSLASSAAQSGIRTLLMDCDLRHPSTSHFFKADKMAGMVDYLAGDVEIQSVIKYDENLRYWYLPAGGKTQNPPDLLGSERMKLVIGFLRTKFDLIVIDTPPVGPVVDPLIVSSLVDKVIFVVRWGATAREAVMHAVDRFSAEKKIAGVVYNYVIDAQAQKYDYAYYYGASAYKKYYTE